MAEAEGLGEQVQGRAARSQPLFAQGAAPQSPPRGPGRDVEGHGDLPLGRARANAQRLGAGEDDEASEGGQRGGRGAATGRVVHRLEAGKIDDRRPEQRLAGQIAHPLVEVRAQTLSGVDPANQQAHAELVGQGAGRVLLLLLVRALEDDRQWPRHSPRPLRKPDQATAGRLSLAPLEDPHRRRQAGVEPALAQKETGNPGVEDDLPLDGRRARLAGQPDQAVGHKRARRIEQHPLVELVRRGAAGQIEDQIDARHPAADIVLEVGEDPPVPGIDLRRQGDQQDVQLEVGQAM